MSETSEGPFRFEDGNICHVDDEQIVDTSEIPSPPAEYQRGVDSWIATTYETTVQPGSGYFTSTCGCWSSWTRDDTITVHWTDADGTATARDVWDQFSSILAGIIEHAS